MFVDFTKFTSEKPGAPINYELVRLHSDTFHEEFVKMVNSGPLATSVVKEVPVERVPIKGITARGCAIEFADNEAVVNSDYFTLSSRPTCFCINLYKDQGKTFDDYLDILCEALPKIDFRKLKMVKGESHHSYTMAILSNRADKTKSMLKILAMFAGESKSSLFGVGLDYGLQKGHFYKDRVEVINPNGVKVVDLTGYPKVLKCHYKKGILDVEGTAGVDLLGHLGCKINSVEPSRI